MGFVVCFDNSDTDILPQIPSPLLRMALVTLYCLHLPALFMANDTTPQVEAPVRSLDKQRVEGEHEEKSTLSKVRVSCSPLGDEC